MHEKPNKMKFILKYGLLYALCLILSLGAGFVAAAAMAVNTLWRSVWSVFGGLTVLSLSVGFLTASAMYKKYNT